MALASTIGARIRRQRLAREWTLDRLADAADDAIMFPGEVPHAYGNSGTEPAHFSLTVYEPQMGSARARKNINV